MTKSWGYWLVRVGLIALAGIVAEAIVIYWTGIYTISGIGVFVSGILFGLWVLVILERQHSSTRHD